MKVLAFIAIVSMLYHVWVGMRDIWMDYVQAVSARLVLQIHDELLFEVPAGELSRVEVIVREEMTGAYPLDPPLEIDVGIGDNWMDAK